MDLLAPTTTSKDVRSDVKSYQMELVGTIRYLTNGEVNFRGPREINRSRSLWDLLGGAALSALCFCGAGLLLLLWAVLLSSHHVGGAEFRSSSFWVVLFSFLPFGGGAVLLLSPKIIKQNSISVTE